MQSVRYKIIEFFVVFIAIPISFVLDYALYLKLGIGVFGFGYIVYVLLRVEQEKFELSKTINWKSFFKSTIIKLSIIAIVTTLFVWQTNKEALFTVLLHKPKLWLFILFVYSFFSVYPQELMYRTFYFKRYKNIIGDKKLLVFINAIVFALAHLFFRNTLVLVLTFLGGILFAITYQKTKSTLLISIEHALYGCWLFTVGMGNILGFPS